VEVSIAVNGKHQLLARLQPGSVFGQVSLIDGEPRSASCTIGRDAVLVELERPECEQLLARHSPLGLKLLALLNDGIIAALRGADRRLLRIEEEEPAAPA
jgi:CRP-like cAMP-binding protein